MEEIMDILTELQEEMLPVNEDCLAAKEDAKDTAKIPIEAKETLQKQHCEIENLCSQLSVATSNENLCTQLEGLATSNENLCSKLEGVATSDENLCSKLEGVDISNENLCSKLEGVAAINENLCSKPGVATSDENLCFKLGVAAINENLCSKPEGVAASNENLSSKLEGVAAINENLCSKPEGVAASNENLCSKPEGVAASNENLCSKPAGVAASNENLCSKPEGVAASNENLCSKPEGVAASNENLCSKPEGVGLATTKELNVSDDKMSDYLDHLFESTTYNNDQTVQFTNLGMKFKDLKKKLNVEFQEYEKKYASAEGCSSLDLKVEQRRSTVCSLRKERDRLQKQAERTTQLKREIAELQRKKIVSEEKYKEEYEKIQAKRNKKDKERIAKKRKNEDHLRDLNNQIGTVMGNIHRIRKNISEMERELINIGS